MRIEFSKMNGAGNDFIVIDNRSRKLQLSSEQISRLCDRHRGVGADGVFLLIPARSEKADWAWEFYNSDGSTAEMCGNGARCFARFIQRMTGAEGPARFETGAGVITAQFLGERVEINLTAPTELRLKRTLRLPSGLETIHSINTGVPHAVLFVPDADRAMVEERGREIRFHPDFGPKGTNVNFVEIKGPGAIRVRTYERGVEGETLACGTGVSASAVISALEQKWAPPVRVRVQGGDWLEVDFKNERGVLGQVRLTGPADFVFEGVIEI